MIAVVATAGAALALVCLAALVALVAAGVRDARRFPTREDLERAMSAERASRRGEAAAIRDLVRQTVAEQIGSLEAAVREADLERSRAGGRVDAEIEHLGRAIGGLHQEVLSLGQRLEASIGRLVPRGRG